MAKKAPGAITHKGKGTQQELLPSRMAMSRLVRGDPMQRTMNNYAKATPSMEESPSIPQIASATRF